MINEPEQGGPRARGWLAPGWQPPGRVALSTGHHLRPVRAGDLDLHLHAVLSCGERLRSIHAQELDWSLAPPTADQDRAYLQRCEAEMRQRQSFTYVLLDPGETELLGGVRIVPLRSDAGVDVAWWVTDLLVGGPIEAALEQLVPAWVADHWPVIAELASERRFS